MNLVDVFDEMFEVLEAADIGLNVPGQGGVRHGPPAPYAELPEITYAGEGPGLDRISDMALSVVFGPANNTEVFRQALAAASTTGEKSIRAALMAHEWTSCSTFFVRSAEPSMETVQGNNPSIIYTFHIDITGAP